MFTYVSSADLRSSCRRCNGAQPRPRWRRRRVGDLFNDKTVTGRLTSMAKKSIKGVENVYTQVIDPRAKAAAVGYQTALKHLQEPARLHIQLRPGANHQPY